MGFFKRKTKKEKLQAAYKMEESFHMSKTNRTASDALVKEAEDILDLIKKEEEAG
jgi:hypothetical protein